MSNTWEGRSKAPSVGFKIFLFLLKVGGLSTAYRLLPWVTAWYRRFEPSATRPLKYLYRNRLEKSEQETKKLIKQNLIKFGESMLDKMALMSSVKTDLKILHENVETIERMRDNKQGGILLSAHIGNWEAAGHMLKRFNWKVNVLMYDGESEQVKAALASTNKNRSFNIIPLTEDGQHIFEVKAALARNELVCINADRFRPGSRTFTTDFLGAPAQFPAGPFILASKLGCPVSFTFALKCDPQTYIYRAYPAKVHSGKQAAEDMLKSFAQVMEKELRDHPDQWFNYYPFWNETDN